ncbi:DUF1488 domain-containing protein [Moellerella wisconsensis]|uniref:DUF1488 domain-containing protein n=1 Tax=Moellerella wisconsensis TaxID=158849 RepID=A0ACD3Y8K4_9GAMM|nr:DUF1488 domain-containing protein [Moellerella wisconsensis]UNH24059.1 DUF1488 domain-containing protein [Moellerella wisconsensis]UNH27141.1 DUF1488 domain-containing protein [Moellerella wisconsensis]UNH38774.1 DUF1488 domain-containing protein [Moellerella wisconsensis]UNH42297.1 DUF1488 domain-containing protein [Moellerella wisconsensis]WJW81751.1 DUF1488 domain-containing protein [Moellerella wisconsensis]
MNQAIQFPDSEYWDSSARKMIFPVLVNGRVADCVITEEQLYSRFGHDIDALSVFTHHRWDIEEEFEALIKQGHEDELGNYLL